MDKIEMGKNPAMVFGALKLIEQLYRDGKISAFMYGTAKQNCRA